MSAPTTSGDYALALWPGQDNWFNEAYDEHEVQYAGCFYEKNSTKQFERTVGQEKFGLAPIKPEGESITYDAAEQTYAHQYDNVVYALGYQVTKEAYSDNQYNLDVFRGDPRALAFAMRQTKENVGANIFNNGFDDDFDMGSNSDGLSLFNSAHTAGTFGSNQSNLLTAADLSEASLEDGLIQVMNATDNRGLNIDIRVDHLLVPNALVFTAQRIVASELQNDTANNAVNAMRSMSALPGGWKNNTYLTDTNAWFLITNITMRGDGLVVYNRWPVEFEMDNDFPTSNAHFKASERYAFGWDDWRGAYGNAGA